MIERAEERFGLKPQRLAADSALRSGPDADPKAPFPRIPRSIYVRARDVARSHAGTEAFERSRHDRKRIEMRFAHLKRILRLGRLRLRVPRYAQNEFTLAAIAQNLWQG